MPDQQIETEVLHRRIKLLFECRQQPMNLIDEEHVAFLQVRQQRRNVSRLFDRRPRRGTKLRAHFIRDDMRERRLAKTRRSGQQNMIERFTSLFRSSDVYA